VFLPPELIVQSKCCGGLLHVADKVTWPSLERLIGLVTLTMDSHQHDHGHPSVENSMDIRGEAVRVLEHAKISASVMKQSDRAIQDASPPERIIVIESKSGHQRLHPVHQPPRPPSAK
jgi:hypothetical protein